VIRANELPTPLVWIEESTGKQETFDLVSSLVRDYGEGTLPW
jgi:hypothetical protein